MRGMLLWARVQIGRRLAGLVAVGAVTGVVTAVALTAVAGARRTATVFERHARTVEAPDAWVTTEFDPGLWSVGVLDPVVALTAVAAHSELVAFAARPAGTDLEFMFDRTLAGAVDDRFGVDLNRFRVVEGRPYEHRRTDEVVLTEDYAAFAGAAVGDVIRFETWTPAQVRRAFTSNFDAGPPRGPAVDLRVVGIAREVQELPSNVGLRGSAYVTAAFTRRWGPTIGAGFPMAAVELAAGAGDYPAFERAARAAGERQGTPLVVLRPGAGTAEVEGAIDAQVLALAVFAVLTGIGALAVTVGIVGRQLAFVGRDQAALGALGTTVGERVVGVVVLGAPIAVTAAVVSAAVTTAASGLLPVGTPGRVEPDPGVRVDPLVLGAGAVGVAALVTLTVALVGLAHLGRRRSLTPAPRRPALGARVSTGLHAPAAVAVGIRHALEPGRRGRSAPARSTVGGFALGAAAVVACLSYSASLRHLLVTPRLHGVGADLYVAASGGTTEWQALAHRMETLPEATEVATAIAVNLVLEGSSVSGAVVDLRRGDPFNVIVSGRAPAAADEMAVGSAVAEALGVGVGDTVSVAMADGGTTPFEVVGVATMPEGMGGYRDQVTVLGRSTERFLVHDEGPFLGVAVGLADGVDREELAERLLATGAVDDVAFLDQLTPKAIGNIAEAETILRVLAATVAALTATFFTHGAVVGTRRRTRELATLGTIGFSRRQRRVAAVAQATTTVIAGLVLGVPLGVVAGRLAWASSVRGLGVPLEHHLPESPGQWLVAAFAAAALLGLLAAGSRRPGSADLRRERTE